MILKKEIRVCIGCMVQKEQSLRKSKGLLLARVHSRLRFLLSFLECYIRQ